MAPKKVEPLIQEFDFKVNFALDTTSGSIYRERETRNLRYLRPGTDEPAIGPPMGPDTRSIVTADQSLEFDPEKALCTAINYLAIRRPSTGTLLSADLSRKAVPGMAPTRASTSPIGSGERLSIMPVC